MNDSERMFELRLQLAGLGHVKDFVDWKSLCHRYPLRAIRLIEAVVSTWEIDEADTATRRKSRLKRWHDQDNKAFNSAVKQHPGLTWDLLMGHIERLTGITTDHYDRRLEKWRDSRFQHHEMDIARGIVELVILAGQTLVAGHPGDKSSDDATVDILFQNTINCVRGVAAGAIGQLLWVHKNLMSRSSTRH